MDISLLSLLFDLLKSLVSSLSWPITIIICLLILKKPLNTLISKIGKLKYGDLEADFSREVREISVNIKGVIPDIKEPEKNSTKTFAEEIEEIANVSPKAAIPYAWTRLESCIYSKVNELGIVDHANVKSPLLLMRSLVANNKIDAKIYQNIYSMSQLRNSILHSNLNKEVSINDAIEYAKNTEILIDYIGSIK